MAIANGGNDMDKNEVLKILETAKDKNGEVPMRLVRQAFEKLPELCEGTISRDGAINKVCKLPSVGIRNYVSLEAVVKTLDEMPPAEPDQSKYEYHYDHTDCIWYRPEARNRCPGTCAQYRDGWNDAMTYIFCTAPLASGLSAQRVQGGLGRGCITHQTNPCVCIAGQRWR